MTFWVAGAVVGSAYLGSRAAKGAAETQAGAARDAAALSNEQYYQTREDQAPFRQGGLTAQNRLMTLLGLRPEQPTAGGGGGGSSVAGMVANAVQNSGAVGGGGAAGGGLNVDPNSPDFGKYARDFSMADFTADPGYAFRLSEGQKALDRSAAARGGLISGGALKAAGRYGQDMASQEFTNAFNRYQINRSNQINPLQGFMTGGQSATNFLGQAGAANANAVGNYMTGGAAAQAAGQVGQANAITGGLGTYLNYSQNNALLNALRTPQTAAINPGYGTSAGYGP